MIRVQCTFHNPSNFRCCHLDHVVALVLTCLYVTVPYDLCESIMSDALPFTTLCCPPILSWLFFYPLHVRLQTTAQFLWLTLYARTGKKVAQTGWGHTRFAANAATMKLYLQHPCLCTLYTSVLPLLLLEICERKERWEHLTHFSPAGIFLYELKSLFAHAPPPPFSPGLYPFWQIKD